MSDMKTFTVRELDRQPAKVLEAADKDGMVIVRRRNGKSYSIKPESGPKRIISLPDFRARAKRIFTKPLSKSQTALLDKLVAGE